MTGSAAQDLEALIRDVVRTQLRVAVGHIEWLRAALGCRRFARVWLEVGASDPQTLPEALIARIEAPEDSTRRPAGVPEEPPLEPIRALLESEGLPVPGRLGADEARGVELLEDLGGRALVNVANTLRAAELDTYYTEACSLIPRLQRVGPQPGVAAFERRLDEALFHYKAERFLHFSVGGDAAATPSEAKVVHDAFAKIALEMRVAPKRLAHRDMQSANIQVVDKAHAAANPSGSCLVMIDLQGAFMAPPEYDLVCLLRDSYVELEESAVAAQLERVRPELPDAPEEELFHRRFDLLTLTRKSKDHALFRYLAAEGGDPSYLRYLPATQRYLETAASRAAARDPDYRDLAELVQSLPQPATASNAEPPCAR